jgi:hypothetical protein
MIAAVQMFFVFIEKSLAVTNVYHNYLGASGFILNLNLRMAISLTILYCAVWVWLKG